MEINGKEFWIKEVKNGIYVINEFNLTTMFVIKGTERALVIDCGVGVTDFKSLVEKLTDGLPYDLVCTHGHVDHIGGRGQFDKIYLNEKDFKIVKDVSPFFRWVYIMTMKLLGYPTIKRVDREVKKIIREPELIPISEGHVFNLGGERQIEVIECPGHTLGSIALLDRADKILFSGDAINPLALLFLKNAAPYEVYTKSGERLRDYGGYDTVWASHFEEPLTAEQVENNIKCGREISKRKRNTFLPFVLIKKKHNTVAIYRTNNVLSPKE